MRNRDLFDADPPRPASALLRAEHADGATLTPAQQRFNKLLAALTRTRTELGVWQQANSAFGHAIQDQLMPAEQALMAAQRNYLIGLDALLLDPPRALKLTGRRRSTVERAVLQLCAELMGNGEAADPEIVAIHDRYSAHSLDALRAMREQEERALMASIASRLGIDDVLTADDAQGTDELAARLRDEFDARAASARAEWASDPQAQRAERNRQRAQARAEAKRSVDLQASVRDIYRKLVRDLHPDRESDPVERDRKTGLMQRINQAYEAGDLLTLLELQFQLEKLDPAKLAQLSAERLKHYTAVLREQLTTLREQLQLETLRAHAEWGLPRSYRPRGALDLTRWIHQQLRLNAELTREFEQGLARLQNPHQLREELEQLIAGVRY